MGKEYEEGGDGGGDEGRSGERAKELKTNVASAAAAQKTQRLLLCGVCLFGSQFQRLGAALRNGLAPEYFFVCLFVCFALCSPHQTQRCLQSADGR